MESIKLNSRRGRGFNAFMAISMAATVLSVTACGSEAGRGPGSEFLGRRELGAADVVANSNEQLKVAVRYLAFRGGDGAVAKRDAVEKMVSHMSDVWSQCYIGFMLENYSEIEPSGINAQFSPANYSELDSMREATQSDSDLEIIGSGKWNRAGDLGNSGSNCYSSFPGDQAQGIVCEASSAASPTIMAHEVGHWLNLYHTDDPTSDYIDDTTWQNQAGNLMLHLVAPTNTELTHGQCARARSAIAKFRRGAVVR